MFGLPLNVKPSRTQSIVTMVFVFAALVFAIVYNLLNQSNGVVKSIDTSCVEATKCLMLSNVNSCLFAFTLFENSYNDVGIGLSAFASPKSGYFDFFVKDVFEASANCDTYSIPEYDDIYDYNEMSISSKGFWVSYLRNNEGEIVAEVIFKKHLRCPFNLSNIINYEDFRTRFIKSFNKFNKERSIILVQNEITFKKSFQDIFITTFNTISASVGVVLFLLSQLFEKYEVVDGSIFEGSSAFEKLQALIKRTSKTSQVKQTTASL